MGIVLVFGFFVLCHWLCLLFSYNASVKASVVLTTANPPAHIRTKRTGRLAEVNYNAGDTVSKDAVLGVFGKTLGCKGYYPPKRKTVLGISLVMNMEALSEQFPNQLRLSSQIRPFYNRFS